MNKRLLVAHLLAIAALCSAPASAKIPQPFQVADDAPSPAPSAVLRLLPLKNGGAIGRIVSMAVNWPAGAASGKIFDSAGLMVWSGPAKNPVVVSMPQAYEGLVIVRCLAPRRSSQVIKSGEMEVSPKLTQAMHGVRPSFTNVSPLTIRPGTRQWSATMVSKPGERSYALKPGQPIQYTGMASVIDTASVASSFKPSHRPQKLTLAMDALDASGAVLDHDEVKVVFTP